MIDVKVYVAQLLLSEAAKFTRSSNGALASASAMGAAAIRLDFVHAVTADQIKGAFADTFDANDVDQNAPGVRDFLNLVRQGRDAAAGQSLTIVLEKLPNGVDAVTYEDTQGVAHTVTGPAGTMRSILSIWLGTPADDGLAKLKTALIGG